MTALALAVLAFLLMEPLTYLAHRFVMHGLGRRLHESHHRRWARPSADDRFVEANDAFPVAFAAVTLLALTIGFQRPAWGALVPVCVGVTAYGAVYAFVHDVYIHQRIRYPFRHAVLDRLARAHELHHRYGGEPYGMLVPVVPDHVRARASSIERAPAGPRP